MENQSDQNATETISEFPKSGLLLSIESLQEISNQYTIKQSDGGDSDGNDSSDGND